MNNTLKLPFYARLPLIFISLFGIIFSLYIAQDIVVPIIMATIFAVLLNPIVNFLESKKINKFFAISLTVFIGLLIVSGLLFFLISQATSFSEALPILKQKFNKSSAEVITYIAERTHIKEAKIQDWIQDTQKDQNDPKTLPNSVFWSKHVLYMVLQVLQHFFRARAPSAP